MARSATGKTDQEPILSKLSTIAKILSLSLVRNISSRQEQVELLHTAGLSQKEIAELLGIKSSNVAVILFNIRRANAKKRATLARELSR